jgi:hypothetical protein
MSRSEQAQDRRDARPLVDSPVARLQASRERLASRLQQRRSGLPLAATLFTASGDALLRPIAKQHPFVLAAAALAGGAALLALRPWRGLLQSALLSRLAAQWTTQLAAQLPVASLLGALQDAALSYMDASRRPMPPPRHDA